MRLRLRGTFQAIYAALSWHLAFSAVTMRKTINGPVRRSLALFRRIGQFDIHSKDFKNA